MRDSYQYNGIKFKNKNIVKWLMIFDFFDWKWSIANGQIELNLIDRDIEVIIDDIEWSKYSNLPGEGYSGEFFGEILLLGNQPRLRHEDHIFGWYCNNSEFEPITVAKFLPKDPKITDKHFGLYKLDSFFEDILTKERRQPENVSLWPMINYINKTISTNTLRISDKISERIIGRTYIDKICKFDINRDCVTF